MKKTLVALAALAVVGAASAQSTVTLYGRIDVTAQNRTEKQAGVKTAPNVGLSVDSAGLTGSRWGLRGTEDLGGGLKANFTLEGGFNIDAGSSAQGGLLFGRQAFAGLSGAFGAVTFGRQYGMIDTVWGSYDSQGYSTNSAMGWAWNAGSANLGPLTNLLYPAQTTSGYGTATAITGFTADNARINNSILYATPAMGGFSAKVMYAPGENKNPTTGRSAASYTGALVGYAAGPLGVMLGWDSTKFTAAAGASAKLSLWSLMGSYDLGVVKLYGGYENGKSTGAAAAYPTNAAGGSNSMGLFGVNGVDKGWMFGAVVPVGAMTLSLGYAREKSTDSMGFGFEGKVSAFGGQLTYPLSKRTSVYADFLTASTKENAPFNFGPGFKNNIVGVGMRHDF